MKASGLNRPCQCWSVLLCLRCGRWGLCSFPAKPCLSAAERPFRSIWIIRPSSLRRRISFQLTNDEWDNLRSQFATANKNISKIRYIPYVFTEHGVLMLSNVLNSSKAINMSIQIIRVFDKLRKYALEQSTKDTRKADYSRPQQPSGKTE